VEFPLGGVLPFLSARHREDQLDNIFLDFSRYPRIMLMQLTSRISGVPVKSHDSAAVHYR